MRHRPDRATRVEVVIVEDDGRSMQRRGSAGGATAALHLGDDLDGLVTYDDRLADAARSNGVHVVAPGTPEGAP